MVIFNVFLLSYLLISYLSYFLHQINTYILNNITIILIITGNISGIESEQNPDESMRYSAYLKDLQNDMKHNA